MSLFEQTGEMLGVWNNNEGTDVSAPTQSLKEPKSTPQPVESPQTSERIIKIEIGGQGNISVSGGGISKEKIVDAMMENLREVFMSIVTEEALVGGDAAYEF